MKIRILVLDPDVELLESVRTFFERTTEFDVRTASNAEECIRQLRQSPPQVLLMEPVLPPGMSQLVLDAIGMYGDTSVPIFVLTRIGGHQCTNHPSVKKVFVKPHSLNHISDAIKQLVLEGHMMTT